MKKILIILCLFFRFTCITNAGCESNNVLYKGNDNNIYYTRNDGFIDSIISKSIIKLSSNIQPTNNLHNINGIYNCDIDISKYKQLSIFNFSNTDIIKFCINFMIIISPILLFYITTLYLIKKSSIKKFIKIIIYFLLQILTLISILYIFPGIITFIWDIIKYL